MAPDPGERPAVGETIALSALKVSGLSVTAGALWLTSMRDQLVARATPGDACATIVSRNAHPVAAVAPAPEGLWLVTGGGSAGRQCVLCTSDATREVRRFACPGGAGGGLAFYRDRLWLSHRHSRRLLVLDPKDGQVERVVATEHEVFSPSVADAVLWIVEAKTGPFGRFSPRSESTYFFSRFDAAAETVVERRALPATPAAATTDGVTVWYAPRDGAGVASRALADLPGA